MKFEDDLDDLDDFEPRDDHYQPGRSQRGRGFDGRYLPPSHAPRQPILRPVPMTESYLSAPVLSEPPHGHSQFTPYTQEAMGPPSFGRIRPPVAPEFDFGPPRPMPQPMFMPPALSLPQESQSQRPYGGYGDPQRPILRAPPGLMPLAPGPQYLGEGTGLGLSSHATLPPGQSAYGNPDPSLRFGENDGRPRRPMLATLQSRNLRAGSAVPHGSSEALMVPYDLRGLRGYTRSPTAMPEQQTERDINFKALAERDICTYDSRLGVAHVFSHLEVLVPPHLVRFSQASANFKSSDKVNTLETTGQTARRDPRSIPPLEAVVMPDGRLTSLDNRRLAAAQLAGAESIFLRVHAFDDPLPNTTVEEKRRVKSLTSRDPRGNPLVPRTWGDAINSRIASQASRAEGQGFENLTFAGSTPIPQLYNVPAKKRGSYSEFSSPPMSRRSEKGSQGSPSLPSTPIGGSQHEDDRWGMSPLARQGSGGMTGRRQDSGGNTNTRNDSSGSSNLRQGSGGSAGSAYGQQPESPIPTTTTWGRAGGQPTWVMSPPPLSYEDLEGRGPLMSMGRGQVVATGTRPDLSTRPSPAQTPLQTAPPIPFYGPLTGYSRNQLASNSRFMSRVLRHKPEDIKLSLDARGWAEIDDLVRLANQRRRNKFDIQFTAALVHDIEKTSDKQRFKIEGTRIRANQGHSAEGVDLQLPVTEPPGYLYHGTSTGSLDSIFATGINSGSRHDVHLSTDPSTARAVGTRHVRPGEQVAVLQIDARVAFSRGIRFRQADNGVWLADPIPVGYFVQTE